MTVEETIESTSSPSTPSSLTDVHRCIGYHNPNYQSLPKSVRLMHLSVYDSRETLLRPHSSQPPPPRSHMYTRYEPPPSPHSSRSHTLRSFGFFHV